MITSGITGLLIGSLIVIVVGVEALNRQSRRHLREIREYKRTHTINGKWAGDYNEY